MREEELYTAVKKNEILMFINHVENATTNYLLLKERFERAVKETGDINEIKEINSLVRVEIGRLSDFGQEVEGYMPKGYVDLFNNFGLLEEKTNLIIKRNEREMGK